MAYKAKQDRYNENDIRLVLPEVNDPLIEIWAPELKKRISFWQVATSPVSRVKISALSEQAIIQTAEATMITGTASENYEMIQTLGTVTIQMCNNCNIKAHVTRSRNVAPFVVDGILGLDALTKGCWVLDRKKKSLSREYDQRSSMPLLRANEYFSDYVEQIREKMKKILISKAKGDWASVSERLEQVRPYFRPEINDEERIAVIDVLDDYADCFYILGDLNSATKLLKYPIRSRANDVVAVGQPYHPQRVWDQIEIIVTDLLRQNILRASKSPFNSPVDLVEKEADARGNVGFHLSVEYEELNDRSELERFPIPSIFDAVDELNGSNYFSVLDLASASYQIAIEPQDCHKTAFTTRSGHYEFLRMPLNIKNGPQYLQRLMNKVLEGIRGQVFVCHDDMLVHSSTMEEHEFRLRNVLQRLQSYGLKLQPGKCQLFKHKVLYLGFLITEEGILPDPAKIKKLQMQPKPQSAKELQSYLGLMSTYKRFFPGFAGRSKPMWDMLKEETFEWTTEGSISYADLRTTFESNLLLRYPDWDRPFIIKSRSTRNGIYAGLLQNIPGYSRPQPIAWESRIYTSMESELTGEELENLAHVYAKDTFRRYVQNTESLDEFPETMCI